MGRRDITNAPLNLRLAFRSIPEDIQGNLHQVLKNLPDNVLQKDLSETSHITCKTTKPKRRGRISP